MSEHAHDDALLGPLEDVVAPAPLRGQRLLHQGAVWDLVQERFDFHGATLQRELIAHPGAVAVLVLDEQDRVLLIRQYRHPVRRLLWEIPAGLLDIGGEDPLTAAKRELAEEADLVAEQWHVLSDYLNSPGGSSEGLRIYLARQPRASETPYERTDEEAQLVKRWVSLEEAVQAVLERRIQNSTAVVALLAAHASKAAGWSSLAAGDTPWNHPPRRYQAGGHDPADIDTSTVGNPVA